MVIKRPKCPPACRLIGKITAEAMTTVLREIENHGAASWWISRVGKSSDGDFFIVSYKPRFRSGVWEMVFGFDGSLWMD